MSLDLLKVAQKSKEASRAMALLPDKIKKSALKKAAAHLLKKEDQILKANQKDIEAAKKNKLSNALIDRLLLNPKRIKDLAKSVEDIAQLPDPNGEVIEDRKNSLGLKIQKVRVPLGVIAIIFESRPNISAEAASLCLKAGNSVILRGGSEALYSNMAISKFFKEAVVEVGIPPDAVSMILDPNRQNIYELSKMDQWIDLLIARGSEQMVRAIREHATVPVLGHGKGVCHVYIDSLCDQKMAEAIALNAKVQRPGVCNAMETLLIHKSQAQELLPSLAKKYMDQGVLLKGDENSQKIFPQIQKASEEDWSTEYLDLILSIKIVHSLEEAIAHINRYGSGHTEAIVTKSKKNAKKFLLEVDSAAVFHNSSTRMHDGSVFGLGAEIGISTQKLHARGTMGVRELTTTKYVVYGKGQIRG